jgi:hypothetical protein
MAIITRLDIRLNIFKHLVRNTKILQILNRLNDDESLINL